MYVHQTKVVHKTAVERMPKKRTYFNIKHTVENNIIYFNTTIQHTDGSLEPYKSHFVLDHNNDRYSITKAKRKCYMEFIEEIKLIRKHYDANTRQGTC